MRLVYHVMSAPAPLGLLFLAASPNGLRHVEFMDRRSLKRTIAAHENGEPGNTWEPSLRDLRPLADQLDGYLSGARRDLDWALDPHGDELSLAVWRALRKVPYGGSCTVAGLAREVGQPRNLRAVAQAVLTNPLAILVPCHRVLGADGKPSNYVGGLPRKKFLISVEQRFNRMGGLDDNRVIGDLVRRVSRPAARVTPARATPARVTPARVAAKVGVSKKRVVVSPAAARAATSLKAPKKRPR
jgi:O-6-methylguanine DNA methyltransferase